MCGEQAWLVQKPGVKDGESLRVRGTVFLCVLRLLPDGIIPAYAGNRSQCRRKAEW
ncbi:MAG: hypothetical protein UZ07_CHB004001208, partial [Chlorobi bacterium OLB7]